MQKLISVEVLTTPLFRVIIEHSVFGCLLKYTEETIVNMNQLPLKPYGSPTPYREHIAKQIYVMIANNGVEHFSPRKFK